jgi:Uma2 family endonuclease
MVAEGTGQRQMSVEAWRELERSGEVRHEYLDGYIYAMASGSRAHSAIAVNAVATLHAALGTGPCQVYNSDVAIRVAATRYTYADVVVTCAASDQATRGDTEVLEPCVVFEVLSESTERKDRGRKWDDYRQYASLQEYVLVGTEYQRVEVYRRTEQGWSLYQIYGPHDTVELKSLELRFPVSRLYQRTDVPESPPDQWSVNFLCYALMHPAPEALDA